MNYLLDTCVISELTRPCPNERVVATALAHNMTLVTRNVEDVAGMGVSIFNPFGDD